MKTAKYFVLISAACSIAACGVPKTYFTNNIRQAMERDKVPLTKIQFYNDKEVVLGREMDEGEAIVKGGSITFVNGVKKELIVLKAHTPGICTQTGDNTLTVSFDMGDGRELHFGKPANSTDNTPYTIFADKWVKNYGEITYDGKRFYIQPGSADARLMIQRNVVNKEERKQSVMKGRKVE